MKRYAWIALALTGALTTAGCATYSEAELSAQCPLTDWYAYGVNDGELGQPIKRAGEFFEGCREVGVEPDLTAYQTGRAAGLVNYCTAESGYRTGVEGRKYHDVCPPQLEPAFEQGLARGRADQPTRAAGVWPYFTVGIGTGGYRRHGGLRSGLILGF